METVIDLKTRLDRRLKSGDARAKTVGTRVTVEEEKELIEAANREGINVSEWVRGALLEAARRVPDDALFTELVATRLLLTNLIKPLLLGKPMPEDWITKAMAGVRDVKHKAAADLRKEYEARARKES